MFLIDFHCRWHIWLDFVPRILGWNLSLPQVYFSGSTRPLKRFKSPWISSRCRGMFVNIPGLVVGSEKVRLSTRWTRWGSRPLYWGVCWCGQHPGRRPSTNGNSTTIHDQCVNQWETLPPLMIEDCMLLWELYSKWWIKIVTTNCKPHYIPWMKAASTHSSYQRWYQTIDNFTTIDK